MLRMLGIALLVVALAGIGYGCFALAWDGGTNRVVGDRLVIGLSLVLAIGATGMIARQSWGWMVCLADGLAIILFLGLAGLTRTTAPEAPASTLLQRLPGGDPQRMAATLGPEWWAESIEELRRREREDNSIARDWEIQGDGRTRLLVLADLSREMRDGDAFPLRLYLLVSSRKGTVVREVVGDFYSADRNAPAELRLWGDRATVIARGSVCVAKSFVLDHDAGTISAAGESGC